MTTNLKNKLKNKLKNRIQSRYSLIATTTLLILSLSQNTVSAAVTLDKIAAIVNNDVVMLTDVHKQVKRLKTQKSFAGLAEKALLKEALESLIMDSLQTQKAKQIGLSVGDTALNITMQDLARQNKLTLEQFQEALQREGIDYQSFREQIRKRLLVNELRKRQLKRNTNITDQAVNDLIANQSAVISKGIDYKIKHILISAPAGTPLASFLQAKDKAELLRAQLLNHKSTRLKETKTSNWIAANNLPASQLRKLALLEKGQLSEVFQDSKGFHIVKLMDKRGVKKRVITEYHVRHILLKTKTNSGSGSNALKNKLAEIRNQILAGANFAALAKQHSQDTGSAVSGGDLGWEPAKSYVPAFAKTIKNTAINTISKPFRSKFGWHILQVLEKKTIDNTEGLLRNQAKGLLNKSKAEKEYDSWLKQLRNDAFVEYRATI
ncbi:MAG: peptidylprolyl isomerase [Thiotrichaceae bacterium]